jgi:hypothetical protein
MNQPLQTQQPASRKTILIALACILVLLPAWIAVYMLLLRPIVFQWLMSTLGWSYITVPIGLHVLVILGLPFGVITAADKLRRKMLAD